MIPYVEHRALSENYLTVNKKDSYLTLTLTLTLGHKSSFMTQLSISETSPSFEFIALNLTKNDILIIKSKCDAMAFETTDMIFFKLISSLILLRDRSY